MGIVQLFVIVLERLWKGAEYHLLSGFSQQINLRASWWWNLQFRKFKAGQKVKYVWYFGCKVEIFASSPPAMRPSCNAEHVMYILWQMPQISKLEYLGGQRNSKRCCYVHTRYLAKKQKPAISHAEWTELFSLLHHLCSSSGKKNSRLNPLFYPCTSCPFLSYIIFTLFWLHLTDSLELR